MINVTSGIYCSYNNNIKEKTPLELEQELSNANKEIDRLNNDIKTLLKENEDYKSRVEKAVEKINYYKYFISLTESEKYMLETLLNILQNGSDSE